MGAGKQWQATFGDAQDKLVASKNVWQVRPELGRYGRGMEVPGRTARWHAQRGGIIFKFLLLCCFVVLLFALYLVRHPLMRLAGHAVIVDDSPRASDAIVMLSDDNYSGDRAARAAELIKGGWAPRVIASGRYLRPYMSVSQLEQHDLIADGVPASAIIPLEHHARNTREECTVIGKYLTQRGWKHILLVTSNYHTRRADYICSRVLPRGTELHVIAAKDSDFNPDDWWDTRQGSKIFFHEIQGLIVSSWELRHHSVQTSD
ncbi:MAG: YdcF family protein [Candidatus Acidiferrales bacterium]